MNFDRYLTILDTLAFLLVTPEITSEILLKRVRVCTTRLARRSRRVLLSILNLLLDHVMPAFIVLTVIVVAVALNSGPDLTRWIGLLLIPIAAIALAPLAVEKGLTFIVHETTRSKMFVAGAILFLIARGLAFGHAHDVSPEPKSSTGSEQASPREHSSAELKK